MMTSHQAQYVHELNWIDYNVYLDIEVCEDEQDSVAFIRREAGMDCTPEL
jgi:hypothetical protein